MDDTHKIINTSVLFIIMCGTNRRKWLNILLNRAEGKGHVETFQESLTFLNLVYHIVHYDKICLMEKRATRLNSKTHISWGEPIRLQTDIRCILVLIRASLQLPCTSYQNIIVIVPVQSFLQLPFWLQGTCTVGFMHIICNLWMDECMHGIL